MKTLTPARVTLLMLLVVGGLIAAYVAKNLWAAVEKPAETATRTVPMAIADLKPGTIVTEAHLGVGRMPVDEISKYPGMLLESRAIVGRMVKKEIKAGTPIISDSLFQPGEQPPLDVHKGMRAVSIPLKDSVSLVDGRISPGQYADVHLTVTNTGTQGTQSNGGITLTLFKGVRILALNSRMQQTVGGSPGSNSVTLELTPGQANIAILAANKGDLTLTYNPEGPGDGGVGVNNEDRATLDEILGLAREADRSIQVENFKGSSRATIRFQNGRRVDGPANTPNLGSNKTPQQDTPSRPSNVRPANDRPSRPRVVVGPRFAPSI